jgi:hypothetical protein
MQSVFKKNYNVECHVLDGSHIEWNGNIRINISEIVPKVCTGLYCHV